MRTKLAAALAAVVLLVAAAPAHAKGPSGGTIEGAGLDAPITISQGEGTSGGDRLIEDVGFFDAIFGMTPSRMVDEAPTTDLGPMLTIRWSLPGPEGALDGIVQALYPYAAGGPLVHTDPGQVFFTSEHTKGGWFRAPDRLLTTLLGMGLPSRAALGGPSDGSGVSWAPIGASLGAVILLVAGFAVLARRRGEVAPAAG
jgi:hypothetical protein